MGKSNWVPDFICRSCSSTLGRWSHNGAIGRDDIMCFCCGAGSFELNDLELDGYDYEDALRLAGREWGRCSEIYPRLNTPGGVSSTHVTAKRALDALNLAFGVGAVDVVKRYVEIDVTKEDINTVIEALNKIKKED